MLLALKPNTFFRKHGKAGFAFDVDIFPPD